MKQDHGGTPHARSIAEDAPRPDLLDEALEETFPASDPISPAREERAESPRGGTERT